MKNFKRVVASVMATSMIASCAGMTTFMNVAAEGETYTVNITHPQDGKYTGHTHTYGAYQIFAGEVKEGDESLYNITWGSSLGDANGITLAKKLVSLYMTDATRYGQFVAFYDNKTLKTIFDLDSKPNRTDEENATLEAAKQNSAFAVADVLQNATAFHNNSLEMYKFAKVVKECISTSTNPIQEQSAEYDPSNTDKENGMASFTLTAPGYYMFYDENAPVSTDNDDEESSTTAYLLKVVGNSSGPIEIKAKVDKPTLDKNIVVNDNDTPNDIADDTTSKVNTASIGDAIHYRLESKVPSMVGYNKFFFNISDTLDETLDFVEGSVKIYFKKGNETVQLYDRKASNNPANAENFFYVTAATYYQEGVNPGDDTSTYTELNPQKQDIKIVFENFIKYQGTWDESQNKYDNSKVGYDIIVEYDAVLMDNARIGNTYSNDDDENEANVNKAKLIYSNDPNVVYNGYKDPNDPNNDRPDEPGDPEDEPTGETPESMVATFTTELELTKVDENKKGLAGAEFKIEGSGANYIVKIEDVFEEDNVNGIYYLLDGGTYTKTPPKKDAQGIEDWDGYETTNKYRKTSRTTTSHVNREEDTFIVTVDADGVLRLKGLGKGTYTITETKAPDGYGKVNEPFTVNIDAEVAPDNYSVTWKKGAGSSDDVTVDDNGLFQLTIQNFPGSVLPGTGGIGTVIFYVVGSLMMAGAAVLFVVKRKAEAKED